MGLSNWAMCLTISASAVPWEATWKKRSSARSKPQRRRPLSSPTRAKMFFGMSKGNLTGDMVKQVVNKGVETLINTTEVFMTNNFNGMTTQQAANEIIRQVERGLGSEFEPRMMRRVRVRKWSGRQVRFTDFGSRATTRTSSVRAASRTTTTLRHRAAPTPTPQRTTAT